MCLCESTSSAVLTFSALALDLHKMFFVLLRGFIQQIYVEGSVFFKRADELKYQ